MKSLLRTPALTLTTSLAILCQIPLVYAEEKSVEVKSGDTLSTLIAEHYPDYKNNQALMQALLAANPASFKNQNIHQLIVGKSLSLPDPSKIPNLQPPEPPIVATVATVTPTPAATDLTLIELKNQLKQLEADKEQLNNQVKELNEAAIKAAEAAKAAEATAPVTPTTTTTDAPDPAILMQQLDEIESANEQILADKNKLIKEQENLKQQLHTLEADKKQLETKLAEQATLAATPKAAIATETTTETAPTTAATETLDPAILNQQLDEIESANEQLLADKQQLEQERDQLKQQLQTLEAENKQPEASSTPATLPPADTASVNPDAPDPAILIQQLDEIEAANEQLLTDKNKLQSDLETAQQQLKEREQTMAALSGQITENKQQLETTQQDLLLANAARASAELNKASLESQRGSWWPWLLALAMLPVGWLLGRRSAAVPSVQPPTTIKATTAAPAGAATVTTTELPTPEVATAPLAAEDFVPVTLAATIPSVAANDDNVDAAIKLDIVRAYLDLRDPVAASSLLKEVMREGGQQQQQEAREILSFLA
ncbi:FimV/HubP family polar landmark protein [Thiothrix eikelboomii]|uniref:FimV/HubP family polar landmark protein n=1 Tax=Thiothrix eikelboomii TaxID=92487 RepID=UPI003BB0C9C6